MFSFLNRNNPDQILRLPDNPDILIHEISKRNPWNKINSLLLNQIKDNSHGDIVTLKGFFYISEIFDLVRKEYVPAIKTLNDVPLPLEKFAISLCSLGCKLNALSLKASGENLKMTVGQATMIFKGAAICDPLQLNAYLGLAYLYGDGKQPLNKAEANRWITKHIITANTLLSYPVEGLSWFHRGLRACIEKTPKSIELLNTLGINHEEPTSVELIEKLEEHLKNY